jgi:hypothetical protein
VILLRDLGVIGHRPSDCNFVQPHGDRARSQSRGLRPHNVPFGSARSRFSQRTRETTEPEEVPPPGAVELCLIYVNGGCRRSAAPWRCDESGHGRDFPHVAVAGLESLCLTRCDIRWITRGSPICPTVWLMVYQGRKERPYEMVTVRHPRDREARPSPPSRPVKNGCLKLDGYP